jgi:hypothetical protein
VATRNAPTAPASDTIDIEVHRIREELQKAVRRELAARGLNSPEPLAQRLDVLPITTSSLLRRTSWPVETSIWLISKLDLPLRISVQNGAEAAETATRTS